MSEYIARLREEKNIGLSIDDETGCWYTKGKPSMVTAMMSTRYMNCTDIHGTTKVSEGPRLYVASATQNQDIGGTHFVGACTLHLCKNGKLGCWCPSHLAYGTTKRNKVQESCYGRVSVLQDDGTEKTYTAHHHCKCPIRCLDVLKV